MIGSTTLEASWAYDLAGRLVADLADQELGAGPHSRTWRGRDRGGLAVASGTYFVRLQVEGVVATRRVTLIR